MLIFIIYELFRIKFNYFGTKLLFGPSQAPRDQSEVSNCRFVQATTQDPKNCFNTHFEKALELFLSYHYTNV